MAFHPLLFSALFLLVCTAYGVSSYGEKELLTLRRTSSSRYGERPGCVFRKPRTQNGATVLEMKHRDYCSRQVQHRDQILQNRLIADDIRVTFLQSQIRDKLSTQSEPRSPTQIPISSGIKLQTLNYIVTVSLGGRNITVIVDTGSDLTWVQCRPCQLCYTQPEPLFNPLLSPSYQSVQCHSPACRSLESATGNLGICGNNVPTCNYAVTYGDGSYTHGELGRDHLVLGTTSIDNFVFGCGRNNKGLFGSASGLMGLGRSDLSLVSQTADVFGGVFSYCLPDADVETSGSFILGDEASVYKNSTPILYTRMVPDPQLYSFYLLNLTGTSIGGVPVQAPGFGKSGILIDSGTVITRLPPSIYRAVKAEFLKQFSGYPMAPGFSILETCFNLSAYQEVNIPTVKLEFDGGVELSVDVMGVFYFVKKDASQVCLALSSLAYEDGIGIIGNYQQRNTRVIYDTKQMKLGFAKETCSFT